MGEVWLFFLLPLSLLAFHGVRGCLECDPKFTDDVKTLLETIVPLEVPGRDHLLERQIKEITHISSKFSHSDKMLRVLDVQNVVNLRSWVKQQFETLSKGPWKGGFILQGKLLEIRQTLESKLKETLKTFSEVACSEDCIVTEGPVLDCWTCLRLTTHCFRGEYCGDDSKKAESQEIVLFLILLTEAVVCGSILLLFHFCVSHRRKMKAIRRSLKKYLEKKLDELMEMAEQKKREDSGTRK